MQKPQIITYFADGKTPETRDMTDEEIASMPVTTETGLVNTNETPNPA